MRYIKPLRCLMALVLPAVVLMGCSSPNGIVVNERQTVVMDSSVLTAGILAERPEVNAAAGRMMATSVLSNTQPNPVTVHYRFFWYDAQGLDIRPFEKPREMTVAPNSDAQIYSINGNLDAKRARLHVFL
ncbi:YcfL family protein [Serratia sp. NPDC078593]|uniref:YcfL family protein n=1 Tax=unclassified Serratia (in: enterobacteria) TaxID=2647522 RepID=UPI0037D7E981